MKNKHINQFLENNPKLDITVRLFDSIVVSKTDMKIFEHRKFGKGRKIVNILFHKTYKNKKSYYHYFWIKNINNIKKTFKRKFVCTICYDKFSTNAALNRHLISCNSMTNECIHQIKLICHSTVKKLQNMPLQYQSWVLLILKQN